MQGSQLRLAERKRKRPRRLRPFMTLSCPMTRQKATWCRMLCEPIDARGTCGRLAPHAMKSARQEAIAAHKERTKELRGGEDVADVADVADVE